MSRFATFGVAVLLLWALTPGGGELLENAMHLALEGHFAHAAPDGDEHRPAGSEHGCAGAVHLCSCCVSLSFLPRGAAPQAADTGSQQLVERSCSHLPRVFLDGVYRPPRA